MNLFERKDGFACPHNHLIDPMAPSMELVSRLEWLPGPGRLP